MKFGNKNPMYGKHHRKDVIEKMINSSRGKNNKLTEKDVEEIKIALYNGVNQRELASKYNVDHTTINKIQTGVNWSYIKSELNDYLKMQNTVKMKKTREHIKNLYDNGLSISEIVSEYGYDYRMVNKVIGKSSFQLIKERNQKISKDFLNGMSKKDLIEKYNLSEHMYKDATKDARSEFNRILKDKAIELRENGITVKEIAILLGKNRTTITEWIKGYADTEVTS